MAYKTTAVSAYRSQEQIRAILIRNGVRGVQFSEDFESRNILVKFAKEVNGAIVTVRIEMRVPEAPRPQRQRSSSTQRERQEQMTKATYRALHYWLKSQFEAVEFGLLSFEDIFLSHFEWIMADGTTHTIGQIVKPMINDPGMLLTATTDEIVDEE